MKSIASIFSHVNKQDGVCVCVGDSVCVCACVRGESDDKERERETSFAETTKLILD